jgi:hypothetical protein
MRFLVQFEFNPEDTDKVLALFQKAREIMEKDPDYFPKHVYPAQYTDNGKGFMIVEVTDPIQWARGYMSGFPEVTWTCVACDDFSKWSETYREYKQK